MATTNPAGAANPLQNPIINNNNNNNDDDDNDSDSFSSDSDDEFLAMGGGQAKSKVDREALIRKKLLESFYGKSAAAAELTTGGATGGGGSGVASEDDDDDSEDDDDDDDDDDEDDDDPLRKADLDAPQFDAAAHTAKHVLAHGVHPLLETEEQLACQVRTLDSSLQTLVYENYSRFIEATDAIKSIGENVQTNLPGLESLQHSMTIVANTSQAVESQVGSLRDQVVEKLRVKRLLQRLDTLLKLPATLKQQIASGWYQKATQSYLSAYSILSKHSEGFESLQRIEAECLQIMQELIWSCHCKLVHWSGGDVGGVGGDDEVDLESSSSSLDEKEKDNDEEKDDKDHAPHSSSSSHKFTPPKDPIIPEPPQTVAEVFECAGALCLVLQQPQNQQQNQNPLSSCLPHSTPKHCQETSLQATLRLLERVLDTHHIVRQEHQAHQEQERRQPQPVHHLEDPTATTAGTTATAAETGLGIESSDWSLIPTHVLDAILEAATLYSRIFHPATAVHKTVTDAANPRVGANIPGFHGTATGSNTASATANAMAQDEQLASFVRMSFSNFLLHVRELLLEQILAAAPAAPDGSDNDKNHSAMTSGTVARNANKSSNDDDDNDDEVQQDTEEKAYEELSNATALLLQSVEELSSGLTLPQIAMDQELASSLVQQTMGLTVAMVRRRVDQKFHTLRLRIIQDCLEPFSQNARNEPLLAAVQLGSVALSDSLQLVDDTIRSVLSQSHAGQSSGGEQEEEEANLGNKKTISSGSHKDNNSSHNTNNNSSGNNNANNNNEEDEGSTNLGMLREAVEQSTKRHSYWLASAMEQLASGDAAIPKSIVQGKFVPSDEVGGGAHHETSMNTSFDSAAGSMASRDMGMANNPSGATTTLDMDALLLEFAQQDDNSDPAVEAAMRKLLQNMNTRPSPDMVLAIAEMCRVAERSVMENIHQSIATHGGGGKKLKTTSLFSGSKGTSTSPTSLRFQLAATRILSQYAMDHGARAATLLSESLLDLSDNNWTVERPRESVLQVLSLVKDTCHACGNLFGGSKSGGPFPDTLPQDEYASSLSMLPRQGGVHHRSSGLALDVERMFAEKITVFPHPSQIYSDFDQSHATVLLFKVALKGWQEHLRFTPLSLAGFRQILVDVEFLQWTLPHYVSEGFTLIDSSTGHGSGGATAQSLLMNLLESIAATARESTSANSDSAEETLGDAVTEKNLARGMIRAWRMTSMEGGGFDRVVNEIRVD